MSDNSTGRSFLSPAGIFAAIAGLILAISVFLPWLSPKGNIDAAYGSSSGMDIAPLIGLTGIIGGLAAVGFSFLPLARLKKFLFIVTGFAAIGVLALVIFNGTLPLRSVIVRTYVSTGTGVYVYGLSGLALLAAGIAVKTRPAFRPQPYQPPPQQAAPVPPAPYSQARAPQAVPAWTPAPAPPPPAAHRYCGSCGQAVKPGAVFCGSCGQAMQAPQPSVPAALAPPSCPRCGRACSNAAVYCPGCGTPLKARPGY